MRALLIAIPAVVALGVGAATVASQERQGRYVMSPTENGFVRLDTETGAMSVCTQRNGRWVCELMEDEAKALEDEAKALQDEISRLRAEVKRLQDEAALAEQAPSRKQPEKQLELPTEEEIDKALDYFENIFRKFRERIEKFEDKDEEKKDGTQL